VPLDAEGSYDDLEFIIRHSGAALIVTEKKYRDFRPRIPKTTCWVEVDDVSFSNPPFQDLSRGPVLSFWPDLHPEDPAVITYLRGASGAWDSIVLTHSNLLSNCGQILRPFRMNDTDRFFCALPLHTIETEVLLLLTPLAVGGRCILRDLSAEPLIQNIRNQQATVLAGPPQLYEKILDSEDFTRADLSSVRIAVCHSGKAGERVYTEFEDRHNALIVETYSRAEATCICCANPYTGVRKPGALGIPLPGIRCAILDAQGDELPSGVEGEIAVRGPNVMKEYFRDREKTGNALRGGWLHTGEFGCIDSDGYYWLSRNLSVKSA